MPNPSARRRVALRAIGIAGLMVVAACNLLHSNDSQTVQALLNESEATWATAAIHNYEYDFQHSCDGCVGDSVAGVHIVVKKDVVTSVITTDGLVPAVPISVFPTVLRMFAITQTALTANTSVIQATFSTQIGYPVLIQIVPRSLNSVIGDVYVVANFLPDST